MTTLVKVPNALQPDIHEATEIQPGQRISTVMRSLGYLKGRGKTAQRSHPYVVAINSEPVMYENWGRRIKSTDVVTVVNMPAGGGDGGSNPLQIVLMVVVIIAAVYTGGAVGAAYGTAAGAAAQAGVMIAGMALISLTTPTPDLGQNNTGRSASPTYTINAQGNMARLGEVQAVTYGRMTQYPDYAATPYTELRGNSQYLYQLFQLTRGHTDIHRILVEDTPIDQYTDISIQIVNPGEKVTLFPSNVYTPQAVNGLELRAPDDENAGPSLGMVGPFVIVPKDEAASAIAFDIHYPRGAFKMNDKGKYKTVNVQYRLGWQQIDENDAPVGSWIERDFAEDINTETPQMMSHRFDVTPGRYQIRAQRLSPKGDRKTNLQIVLSQCRAYMPPTVSYGNVTMLAMVIKATNQINQSTQRKIKVEHTRRLSKWDPVNGWTAPVATRNPVWAYLDIMRDTEYGAGLPNNRFDLRELARLAAIADARGDNFDYVYDSVAQTWGAAALALRALRSTPAYLGGQITAIRNEPRTLPVAMFSPDNMIAGSFNTEYQFADGVSTPDYVVVEYTNWQTNKPETVDCWLPGSKRLRPVTLKLPGITDRNHAWREGMSVCAQNRDQRRLITFQTELAGLIPRYQDLIQISHDVPQWGYSGHVTYYNSDSQALLISDPHTGDIIDEFRPYEMRTSEPVPFDGTGTHQIAFRRRDGSMHGPFNCIKGPKGDNSLIIQGTGRESIYVSNGGNEELTGYQFGPATRRGIKAVCLSAIPDENGRVRVTATNYADSVHAAENGGLVPPPGPESNLPGQDGAPVINRVTLEETAVANQQIIVATPASGASYYEFEVSHDGNVWVNYGISAEPYYYVNLEPGKWFARVRAFGRAMGPWTTGEAVLTGNVLPIPRIESASASTDKILSIELQWAFELGLQELVSEVEIFASLTENFANASKFIDIPAPGQFYNFTTTKHAEERWFWFRVIDTSGRVGPWFNNAVGIRGQASADADPILDLIEGQLTSEAFIENVRKDIDAIPTIITEIDSITDQIETIDNSIADIPIIKQDLEKTNTRITTETKERKDADVVLTSRINSVESTANGMGALIRAEEIARVDADNALGLRINQVQAQGDRTAAAVRTEEEARIQGDTALASRINQVEAKTQQTFDTEVVWNFDTNADGWLTSNTATPLVYNNVYPNFVSLAKHASIISRFDRRLVGAQAIDAKQNRIVRIRCRSDGTYADNFVQMWAAVNGSTGTTTSTQAPFLKASQEWQVLEFDLNAIPTVVTADNISRILFGNSVSGLLEVDYVAVGRYSVPLARAAFRDEVQARIDGDEAVTTQVTQLKANVDNNAADIKTEQTVRANADTALSNRVEAVQATANNNTAAIKIETAARADADSALGQRITTMGVDVGNNKAAIRDEAQARVNGDTALATRIDQVEARSGDPFEAEVSWSFDSNTEGWTSNSTEHGTLSYGSANPQFISLRGKTASGATMVSPILPKDTKGIDFRIYGVIEGRIRFRNRSKIPGLAFAAYFDGTTGSGTSPGTVIAPVELDTTDGGWQKFTIDLHQVYTSTQLAGFTKLTRITVGNVAHDAVGTVNGTYDLDFVSIGRYGNGISRSVFREEITTLADKDSAMALQITQMQSNVAGNTAAIASESRTRADADTALATRIDQVEAQSKPDFDTDRVWNFDTNAEGWVSLVPTSATVVHNAGAAPQYIRLTSTDAGATYSRLDSAVLPTDMRFDPKINNIMRIRVRFPAKSKVNNMIAYVAINDSNSFGQQYLRAPVSIDSNDWQLIDFDLSKFPGDVPLARNISRICFGDTRATQNGNIDFDYIAIGRYSAPFSHAAFRDERTARVDAEGALSRQITTVSATANAAATKADGANTKAIAADAKAQTAMTATADLKGQAEANYAIKVQAASNGKLYGASMSLNVLAGPNGGQSDVAFIADRFSIMHDTNGAITLPFVVQNGQVLIRQALIGTAWITNAHIADAAITYAKIAAAQVGNAHIINGSIDNAKIVDAAITTAKIGHAQIDTLRIAGGAVVTGNALPFNLVFGRSSGNDSGYHQINLPYGGTILAFVQANGFFGDASYPDPGSYYVAAFTATATDGTQFISHPTNLSNVAGSARWVQSATYVSAAYGAGGALGVTVLAGRPNTGTMYIDGRIALLGIQR